MIKKFNDHRGDFVLFDANNCDQVNVVTNKRKYTFRGLHYQTNPPQTKMVKIIQGKVQLLNPNNSQVWPPYPRIKGDAFLFLNVLKTDLSTIKMPW